MIKPIAIAILPCLSLGGPILSFHGSNSNGNDGTWFADIAVNNKYALIGNHSHGPFSDNVHIYDISTPSNPTFIKNKGLASDWPGLSPLDITDVEILDNVAYFCSDHENGGVFAYDISQEITSNSIEQKIGHITWHSSTGITSKAAHTCQARKIGGENYLFIAHPFWGVDIWRVTNIKTLGATHIKSYQNFAHDIDITYAKDGKVIMVAACPSDSRIRLYDISNFSTLPSSPHITISDNTAGYVHNAILDPNKKYLYVTHENGCGGLTTYNIDWNNGQATQTAFFEGGGTSHTAYFRGDKLIASWYSGGVKLFSLSDPAQPSLLESIGGSPSPSCGIGGGIWGLAFNEKPHLYFASQMNVGLMVFRNNASILPAILSILL